MTKINYNTTVAELIADLSNFDYTHFVRITSFDDPVCQLSDDDGWDATGVLDIDGGWVLIVDKNEDVLATEHDLTVAELVEALEMFNPTNTVCITSASEPVSRVDEHSGKKVSGAFFLVGGNLLIERSGDC